MSKQKIIAITGPSSSGKTALAVQLAKELDGEIISVDSRQIYKGLDIGTAKPSIDERNKITHHLIDIIEPSECYTAGLFVEHTERLIDDIRNRGNIPLIVGGTGLYIKSLRDGIFNCPKIDPNIRKNLQNSIEDKGLKFLYEKLQQVDSQYAEKISCNDPVRIVRALEVYEGLGVTFTEAHKKYKTQPKHNYSILVLYPDRASLYEDINKLTDLMWNNGLVEETKSLLDKGFKEDCFGFR